MYVQFTCICDVFRMFFFSFHPFKYIIVAFVFFLSSLPSSVGIFVQVVETISSVNFVLFDDCKT